MNKCHPLNIDRIVQGKSLMKRFILLLAVLILLAAVVSPIAVSSEDAVSNDATIAKLEFQQSMILADPECPPPGGGQGC